MGLSDTYKLINSDVFMVVKPVVSGCRKRSSRVRDDWPDSLEFSLSFIKQNK